MILDIAAGILIAGAIIGVIVLGVLLFGTAAERNDESGAGFAMMIGGALIGIALVVWRLLHALHNSN